MKSADKASPSPRGNARFAGFLRFASECGWVQACILVVAVVLAYQPVWHAGFIWDDDAYVTNNPTLRAPGGLQQIWFNVRATPQYYPLVHTTYWLEHRLWGMNPRGYHLTNVLLHAAAAVLLWRALKRLAVPGAWLAAAIFAVHPIEVESAAWITERKNVLSAVFYFSAALAYWRFADPSGVRAPGRWKWYAAALLLFGAALGSKTVTCSLPAALLLVAWWKQGKLRWADVRPLIPFFLVGAALGLLTAWLERHHVGAGGAEWSLNVFQRCLIAGRALWFYAGKLIWPAPLAFIYPRWNVQAAAAWQWLFPIAALGVVAALWLARRRLGRGPVVAALFFAGTLGPALGFVDVYPFRYSFVADHFQYLAGIGLIVPAAVLLSRLPKFVPAVLIIVLAGLTWQRSWVYRDLEALWRDTTAKNPDSWLAHNNLGIVLEQQNRLDEALREYTAARAAATHYAESYNNIGNVLTKQNRLDEAMENYQSAIRLKPDYVDAITSLGFCVAMKGNYPEAIALFERALQLNPGYAQAHVNLGNVARLQNRPDQAIEHYRRAARLAPESLAVRNNLVRVLEEQGQLPEAAELFREMLKLKGADPELHLRRARVLARQGLDAEAVAEAHTALRLQTNFPAATQLLEALQSPAGR